MLLSAPLCVAGTLTVGRRPRRGYKESMSLAQAYERLGLLPQIEHEKRALMQQSPDEPGVRGVGTTMRTLLEMYLDMDVAHRALYAQQHRVNFLYVCVTPSQGRALRDALGSIHARLDLDVDVARVQFFAYGGRGDLLRGKQYPSWGVFCDHSVKEREGHGRNYGPYGIVRTLERVGDRFMAYDREGRRLCILTKKGMEGIVKQMTCPIEFRESSSVKPISLGAWSRSDVMSCFRLKRAYTL